MSSGGIFLPAANPSPQLPSQLLPLYLAQTSLTQYVHPLIQTLPFQEPLTYYLLKEMPPQLMSIGLLHKQVIASSFYPKLLALSTLLAQGPLIQNIIQKTQKVQQNVFISRMLFLYQKEIMPKDEFFQEFFHENLLQEFSAFFDLEHQWYRAVIAKFDSTEPFLAQIRLWRLHSYALTYLCTDRDQSDIQLLLSLCENLQKGLDPGILVQVLGVFQSFGSKKQLQTSARILVKMLNLSSEIKLVIIEKLIEVGRKNPEILEDKFPSFFINMLEKHYVKLKKIELLEVVANDYNFNKIVDELMYYIRSDNLEIQQSAIRAVGNIGKKQKKYLVKCTKVLLNLLKNNSKKSIDEIAIQLCRFIKEVPIQPKDSLINLPILAQCAKLSPKIHSTQAKLSIMKLLSTQIAQIPSIVAEFIRNLTQNYTHQSSALKIYLSVLTLKLLVHMPQNIGLQTTLLHILLYQLQLGSFDSDITVKDFSRLLASVLQIQEWNSYSLEEFNRGSRGLKGILEDSLSEGEETEFHRESYVIGSLSWMVKKRMPGLIEFPQEKCGENTEALRSQPIVCQEQQQVEEVQQEEQVSEKKEEKREECVDENLKRQNLGQKLDSFFQDDF